MYFSTVYALFRKILPLAGYTLKMGELCAAEQAGFHPSKRQPLPMNHKLWESLKILAYAIFGQFAILISNIEIGWAKMYELSLQG